MAPALCPRGGECEQTLNPRRLVFSLALALGCADKSFFCVDPPVNAQGISVALVSQTCEQEQELEQQSSFVQDTMLTRALSGLPNSLEWRQGKSTSTSPNCPTLPSTLHLVDGFAVMVDHASRLPWSAHFGGSLGALAVTDVDTYNGQTSTDWGLVVALYAGADPFRLGRWSIGAVVRLSVYRYGSDSPPPSATVNAVLPTVLVAFTRD